MCGLLLPTPSDTFVYFGAARGCTKEVGDLPEHLSLLHNEAGG